MTTYNIGSLVVRDNGEEVPGWARWEILEQPRFELLSVFDLIAIDSKEVEEDVFEYKATINWASRGSVGVEEAREFSDLLSESVRKVEELQELLDRTK